MKKLGLTLSLVSSLFLCTACVSEDATSVKLTVAASSSASGVVLLSYNFYDNGKPFVDDGRYIKWYLDGFYTALYECRQNNFGAVKPLDEESELIGEMKDGKLIKGDVMRRFQCVLPDHSA